MTTVEALKALYVALGGAEKDVSDCVTNVDVLNVISAKYQGADDAVLNPEAIANITEVAGNIGGGSSDTATVEVDIGGGASLIAPNVYSDDDFYTMEISDDGTYQILLYNGKGFAYINDPSLQLNVETTGDITYYAEQGMFLITGNGSISISSET